MLMNSYNVLNDLKMIKVNNRMKIVQNRNECKIVVKKAKTVALDLLQPFEKKKKCFQSYLDYLQSGRFSLNLFLA